MEHLRYDKKQTKNDSIAYLYVPPDHYDVPKKKFTDGMEEMKITEDQEFWIIIERMLHVLTQNDPIFTKKVRDFLINKKMLGVYSLLEIANVIFIEKIINGLKNEQQFIVSSEAAITRFECNEEDECFHAELIVSTGMRAINLAHFCAMFWTRAEERNTNYMYYETAGAIKTIDVFKESKMHMSPKEKKIFNETVPCMQKTVRFIDLNHCVSSGDVKKNKVILDNILEKNVKKNNEKLIIFDYTSATSMEVNEAINKFIKHVDVIILVSSGLKNEQLGADTNPYGTIRIITILKNELESLYRIAKDFLNEDEVLPPRAHAIINAYRSVGATLNIDTIGTNRSDMGTIETIKINFINVFNEILKTKDIETLLRYAVISFKNMCEQKKIKLLELEMSPRVAFE